MDQLSTLWGHLQTLVVEVVQRWHVDATPAPLAALAAALAAITLACFQPTWRLCRQAATIVHEMGHAAVGYIFGRKIDGIALHSDTSGVTTSRGKPYGIGFLLSVLAGYPAPSLLGLGMVWASTTQWSGAALTLLTALMAVALWLCRNAIGFLSCAAAVAASGAIWWWGTPPVVTNTVLAVGVFMVIAGIRCCLDLWGAHKGGNGATSDAGQASSLTVVVPSTVWIGFFFAVSIYAAAQSGIVLYAAFAL